eukprot:13723-Hanusia_phi.AAC.1
MLEVTKAIGSVRILNGPMKRLGNLAVGDWDVAKRGRRLGKSDLRATMLITHIEVAVQLSEPCHDVIEGIASGFEMNLNGFAN